MAVYFCFMFSSETLFFLAFAAFVLLIMALDLGVFSKRQAMSFNLRRRLSGVLFGLPYPLLLFFPAKFRLSGSWHDWFARLQEVRDKYADHVELVPGNFRPVWPVFRLIWPSNISQAIWLNTPCRQIIFSYLS